MTSKAIVLAVGIALLIVTGASATTCDLQMTLTCESGRCTARTTNTGASVCSGTFISAFGGGTPLVKFSGMTTSLGLSQCFSSSDLGIPDSSPFALCMGDAALGAGASFTAAVSVSGEGGTSSLQIIGVTAVFDPGTGDESALVYAFSDTTLPTCTPIASVPPVTQSGLSYSVIWTPVTNPTSFEIEESTSPDFSSNVTRQVVSSLQQTFRHDVNSSTIYYYRVRATSCNGAQGPFSTPVQVVVQALPATGTTGQGEVTVPLGSVQPASTRVFIPGEPQASTFTATTDKPFLTVSPASGTLPTSGATLTVTANPSGLPPGASTGTVLVTSSTAKATSVPVTISLVTPVSPGGKTVPTGNTLIIPVVTHVNGGTGPFQSDVRLTNASGSPIKYQLTLAPTRTNATLSSKATAVTVEGGQTIALNDIVKNFFGLGATGDPNDVGFGALEIRPLNTSSTLTYASSRTFVTTAQGTLGQFIAAVPFEQFATKASAIPFPGGGGGPNLATPVLSLQQIAQSTKFRTNLGLVEGSGTPASGTIRVLDLAGNLLKAVSYSLLPGEHQQHNQFLTTIGIPTLEDGRIEITVDSPTGAVTAYASVLDQKTTDPLAVMPVQVSNVRSSRYVLPGVADLNNGPANFHSDVRILNGGTTPQSVTLTYFPQSRPNDATRLSTPVVIAPGEVKAFDNILPTLFNVRGEGGSLLLTTPQQSSLVVTGRTYSIGPNEGTFGLFVPGVTPEEARGAGERALQILQLEQSPKFRSNLGLAEVSGNPARIRITLSIPDSKASPSIERDVQPNEFFQYGSVINQFLGAGRNTYNARIFVEVLSGAGRMTAYGSVIDNATQDPTYVPAQ